MLTFWTMEDILATELDNYVSCSHWGLFKHDYSLDLD